MFEYECMRVLFKFLAIPRNNKKHLTNTFSWQMAEFMHQQLMVTTRATITTTWYVSINYDEVSTLDNQSWLLVHCYVVEYWVRIPILIYIYGLLEGFGFKNLTKVTMEALTIRGGMPRDQVANELMSFGINCVNVFQGAKSSVTKQIHDDYAPISMAHHLLQSNANFICYTFGETHWKFLANLACIVCTFSQMTFGIYKNHQYHGNNGE